MPPRPRDEHADGRRPTAETWHLLTGEYPPAPGGVADYSRGVARGLAAAGADVHVWTADVDGPTPDDPGITLHRGEAGRWAPADLGRLGAALDRFPAPRRLLVQYTPKAWGLRGANLPFCRWLVGRRRAGDHIRLMIHEAVQPWRLRDKPRRWVLAAVNRRMLRHALAAASRVDISSLAWADTVRAYAPRPGPPVAWRPVPCNLPVVDAPRAVEGLRRRLAPRGEQVVGIFSNFGHGIDRLAARVLPPLLEGRDDRVALLLGRESSTFAPVLLRDHPALQGRVIAAGALEPEDASLHLQACDLLVQPYADGVSSRRGTLMAGLAHARPVVTNLGRNSDPIWETCDGDALAVVPNPDAIAPAAEALLSDPAARARLGDGAARLYDRLFAVDRTVEALLSDADRPHLV